MTTITMKAIDTLHVSNAGPDNIAPGSTFEVPEADAKALEERGLAKRVGAAKKADDIVEPAAPAKAPAKRAK